MNGLQTSAYILCLICRFEENEPDHHSDDSVRRPYLNWQKEWYEQVCHEKYRHKWDPSNQFNVADAEIPYDRQRTAPSKRQQNAKRQRSNVANNSQHQREQETAPNPCWNWRKPWGETCARY